MDHREGAGEADAGARLSAAAAGILRAATGDTIVAQATPAGRGAVALIRLSGGDVDTIAAAVVTPWPIAPRRPQLCALRDPASGVLIDRALVTLFEAPRSFTGERVVEVSTHGGFAVPAGVMAAFVAAGARDASPGEFTRRAVLNGKLDLIQAESIGDLIDARTGAMRRLALAQLDGGLSRQLAELRSALLDVEALLAYDIDFPEEDDGPVPRARIARAAAAVTSRLDELLRTAAGGELVREGATVVIAGPPNCGKSSLFNAIVGRARALVTEIPGTTRDALEALVDAGPWPVRLIDTAGLRATSDPVERLGIELAEQHVRDAQLVLACAEDREELEATVAKVRELSDHAIIGVRTKADLHVARAGAGAAVSGGGVSATVAVSARTREGIAALLDAMAATLTRQVGTAAEPDTPVITRARHRRALESAREEVAGFERVWAEDALPATIAAVHLRSALGALDELVGGVTTDDVLDRVFSTFCVGK